MATATRQARSAETVRTNVVLDKGLLEEAKELTSIRTTRGVLEEALRTLIQIVHQEALLELRGTIEWEGDLDEMRRGRFADGDR